LPSTGVTPENFWRIAWCVRPLNLSKTDRQNNPHGVQITLPPTDPRNSSERYVLRLAARYVPVQISLLPRESMLSE